MPTNPEVAQPGMAWVVKWCLALALCLFPRSNSIAQDAQKILGLEDSQFHTVWEWNTVDLEQPDIWNVMGHIQTLPPTAYDPVSKAAKPWAEVAQAEDTPGNRMVRLKGQLLAVRKPRAKSFGEAAQVKSEAEALALATRWVNQDTQFYWCELAMSSNSAAVDSKDDAAQTLGVLVCDLPSWLIDNPTVKGGETLRFESAVHVALAGIRMPATTIATSTGRTEYKAVVLGKRLGWYPSSKQEIETVAGAEVESAASDWLGLATRGFDLGLLPPLFKSQRAGLLSTDSEPFYQLLATVGKRVNQPDQSRAGFPIANAIVSPRALVGRRFQQELVVKQITQVPLGGDERGRQLGLDRYYLLHTLMPLEKDIRLQRRQGKEQLFQQQYPVLVACRSLPEGWELGDQMRNWCRVDGTFVKMWSYESAKSRTQQIDQWAPLLVADSVQPTSAPASPTTNWPIGWLLMIPVGLASLGLLWGGWTGWKAGRK